VSFLLSPEGSEPLYSGPSYPPVAKTKPPSPEAVSVKPAVPRGNLREIVMEIILEIQSQYSGMTSHECSLLRNFDNIIIEHPPVIQITSCPICQLPFQAWDNVCLFSEQLLHAHCLQAAVPEDVWATESKRIFPFQLLLASWKGETEQAQPHIPQPTPQQPPSSTKTKGTPGTSIMPNIQYVATRRLYWRFYCNFVADDHRYNMKFIHAA
jgi:hypothetical protein